MRLQAVALFGLGVGRVEQRHAALGPQPLDLIKVLSDVGGFLRRDAPPMRPRPRRRGGTGRCGCWVPMAFMRMVGMSPLEASLLKRSTDSNARWPLRSPG